MPICRNLISEGYIIVFNIRYATIEIYFPWIFRPDLSFFVRKKKLLAKKILIILMTMSDKIHSLRSRFGLLMDFTPILPYAIGVLIREEQIRRLGIRMFFLDKYGLP